MVSWRNCRRNCCSLCAGIVPSNCREMAVRPYSCRVASPSPRSRRVPKPTQSLSPSPSVRCLTHLICCPIAHPCVFCSETFRSSVPIYARALRMQRLRTRVSEYPRLLPSRLGFSHGSRFEGGVAAPRPPIREFLVHRYCK